jgi:hypothetical protein
LQDTFENIVRWADGIIVQWRSKKITLQQGASLEKISNTENKLGFVFPQSFKVLYRKANGLEILIGTKT